MSVEERLRELANKVETHAGSMVTEEAVKTAVVLPFLHALGYDVFNPHEVIPEFTADAVGKKGEKVDYAIKIEDQIRILIECKPITVKLERVHLSQLYRYFSVTAAKFAVLTNGRTFHFHTDLDEPNKLDQRPFLTFDLADLQGPLLAELKKFAKAEFNLEGILASASRLKYTYALKAAISELMEEPTEDFVRLLVSKCYDGRFTAAIKDQFTPLVRTAYRETIREAVQQRLASALANTVNAAEAAAAEFDEESTAPPSDGIETTEEEREGYLIVKAIVGDVLKPSRVVMRDQKSYCGVLVDDNNRKPLARLHFNRGTKYLGLFNEGKAEERVKIDDLDEIYLHADKLRQTAKTYA